VVKTAFGQRRKTIGNSLKKLLPREQLLALDIDPSLRAENLNLLQFTHIANHLETST